MLRIVNWYVDTKGSEKISASVFRIPDFFSQKNGFYRPAENLVLIYESTLWHHRRHNVYHEYGDNTFPCFQAGSLVCRILHECLQTFTVVKFWIPVRVEDRRGAKKKKWTWHREYGKRYDDKYWSSLSWTRTEWGKVILRFCSQKDRSRGPQTKGEICRMGRREMITSGVTSDL